MYRRLGLKKLWMVKFLCVKSRTQVELLSIVALACSTNTLSKIAC